MLANLENCNEFTKNFLFKIFSFKKFVNRKYAVLVCVNAWMALLKYSILSRRLVVNSLYPSRMEN